MSLLAGGGVGVHPRSENCMVAVLVDTGWAIFVLLCILTLVFLSVDRQTLAKSQDCWKLVSEWVLACTSHVSCHAFPPSRFGKQYELPLLTQSVIMVATMMVMMHLCTAVKAEEGTLVTRRLLGQSAPRMWYQPLPANLSNSKCAISLWSQLQTWYLLWDYLSCNLILVSIAW